MEQPAPLLWARFCGLLTGRHRAACALLVNSTAWPHLVQSRPGLEPHHHTLRKHPVAGVLPGTSECGLAPAPGELEAELGVSA